MKVRITYYRGVFLPILNGFDVTVDGEHFASSALRFGLGGRTYTMDDLGKAEKVHWDFGDFATLTVLKPGGLKPGIHDVELIEIVKPSYMGPNGFVGKCKKKMTLVV